MCAGDLAELAVALKFYTGHGWPDINTGLDVLATEAVQEATVRVRVLNASHIVPRVDFTFLVCQGISCALLLCSQRCAQPH